MPAPNKDVQCCQGLISIAPSPSAKTLKCHKASPTIATATATARASECYPFLLLHVPVAARSSLHPYQQHQQGNWKEEILLPYPATVRP